MITFYFSPGSSSMATHIALNEAGASFEARPLTLQKGTRAPDFLEVNPNGKVPTLVVDGTILTEVAGTLFYLARAFPQAGLMPAGALGEAEAVSWMSFDASTLHPAAAQGPERVAEVWRIAEHKLGGTRDGASRPLRRGLPRHLPRRRGREARSEESLQKPPSALISSAP